MTELQLMDVFMGSHDLKPIFSKREFIIGGRIHIETDQIAGGARKAIDQIAHIFQLDGSVGICVSGKLLQAWTVILNHLQGMQRFIFHTGVVVDRKFIGAHGLHRSRQHPGSRTQAKNQYSFYDLHTMIPIVFGNATSYTNRSRKFRGYNLPSISMAAIELRV